MKLHAAPLLALALLGGTVLASDPPPPPPPPDLAVKCGRLLDPATRSVKADAVVHLSGGSVAQKGSPGETPLDLSRFTCVPGLVDAHTHLLLQGDATSAEYDDQVLKESTPYRALRAAAAARIALSHGFTTLRDLGTEGAGFTDVDLKKAFDKGVLEGPRVYTSGPAMGVTGSYPLSGFSWERKMPDGVLKCDGADDCRRAVRYQVERGVDWIKVYADRSYYRTKEGGWASLVNFTPEELRAVVDESHRQRRKVSAHSMTPSGHRAALAAGADTLEHGDVLDEETVKEMAARKVAYCPTITVLDFVRGPRSKTNPVWDQLWAASRESFQRALRAGAPIVFGTDAGGFDWDRRNQAEEFGFMVAWGMSPWDALRSATTGAAELLGEEGRLGCLAPGCVADLVAYDGDPLADPKVYLSPKAVVTRGRLFVRP